MAKNISQKTLEKWGIMAGVLFFLLGAGLWWFFVDRQPVDYVQLQVDTEDRGEYGVIENGKCYLVPPCLIEGSNLSYWSACPIEAGYEVSCDDWETPVTAPSQWEEVIPMPTLEPVSEPTASDDLLSVDIVTGTEQITATSDTIDFDIDYWWPTEEILVMPYSGDEILRVECDDPVIITDTFGVEIYCKRPVTPTPVTPTPQVKGNLFLDIDPSLIDALLAEEVVFDPITGDEIVRIEWDGPVVITDTLGNVHVLIGPLTATFGEEVNED